MTYGIKESILRGCQYLLIYTPWVSSIYIFYWLDSSIWSSETDHRGKISVFIMMIGMYASLNVWNYFKKDK